ncbi:MAG TPA: response regulator transcription factor [Terriglobales bacterium]|nr:response regulator transcription factor [Terriglobales bacterium]
MSAVLIVEDEKHLANGLRFNLEAEGYRVELAGDGERALERLKAPEASYDAVILDVMLPGVDGFQVATELRQAGVFTPILMLTARGRPEDVLRGFEAGADDYLPKPFDLAILLARLRGLLRRHRWSRKSGEEAAPANAGTKSRPANGPEADEFVFDGKRIDFGALELHVAGQVVRLTAMEAELLRYLVQHAGKAVSRKAMLRDVWGLSEETDTRAIDNFIVRLRRYIEKVPSRPQHLLTVRGVGYRFIPVPGKPPE